MIAAIDAHQHYWDPARGDYDWMPRDHPVLARPWLPADLEGDIREAGIARTVLVQAAASIAETEFILGIADGTPSVAKVVGWVDFEKPEHRRHLERFVLHPKFAGVRPMIQDVPDTGWMLKPQVQWGYAALAELGLCFEALGFSRHLANFLTVLTRYPGLRAVIDHGMKPQIRNHGSDREEFSFWAAGIRRIARETGALCKLSGLVTESNPDWTVDDLRPYAEVILEEFGPARVMFGSDWPVVLLRAKYAEWLAAARALTAELAAEERAQIFGGTAARFYGIV